MRKALLRWSTFVFLFVCAGAFPARAQTDLVDVVLQLKWHHQFQFAGYYAALEKGYYKEAGLAVTLREAHADTHTVEDVLKGHADFGVGTSELMISYAKGQPVLMVAPIFQHSPLVMLVRADAGIESVHDLPGKQIMIEPQSAQLLAYFLSEGIQLEQLKYQQHNFSSADLMAGRIDGLSAYISDEPFLLEQAKIPYRIFTPRANGMDFYGDTLFTSQQYFSRFPERVKTFREASLKGWEYALEHPEETIALIHAKYNSQGHTVEQLRYEAKHTFEMIRPDFVEVGYSNPGRWKYIQEVYQKYNLMPQNTSFKGFFYTDKEPTLRLPLWASILLPVSVLLTSAMALILLLVAFFNRQLRQEILEREKMGQALMLSRNELSQANMAKRDFLAHMSHEIRTPMNGLVSMLSLLKNTPLPTSAQHYVEIAHHSAGLLLNLVGDILDFSRIEAGKLELDPRPFSLHAKVSEVVSTLAIQAHQKGLAVHVFLPVPAPPQLWGDASRIQQVLFNLMGNAIKFTETGHVRLEITLQPAAHQTVALTFKVFDTGIGVDVEALKDLFQPFQQQDVSIGRRFGGSGLGLAIAQQLIHLMEGEIWGEALPEGGSCFGFRMMLPYASTHTQEAEASVEVWPRLPQRIALCGFSRLEDAALSHILVSAGAEVVHLTEPQAVSELTTPVSYGVLPISRLNASLPTIPWVVIEPLGAEKRELDGLSPFAVCAYPVVGMDFLTCFVSSPPAEYKDEVVPQKTYAGTVLLVEDNPINQLVARAILEKLPGQLVLWVANHGEEALELLTEHPEVDLVLMDLHMPVLDGFETLKKLREDVRWSDLPVVAVTAQALEGDRDNCLRSGFNDYLSKPFLPEHLEQVLKNYLL